MESVRLQDELPLLQQRFPDPARVFRQKAPQLQWEDPDSLELAVSIWSRLKKGASIVDLQKDIARCSYFIYKTVAGMLDADLVA
jgi:hypothetical protein